MNLDGEDSVKKMFKKTECSGGRNSLNDMYRFGCLCLYTYNESEKLSF